MENEREKIMNTFLLFVDGRTVKKESNRPCVVPVRALASFFVPFRTRSSLNCLSPHKNLTKPSSSGSVHFNCEQKRIKIDNFHPGSRILMYNLLQSD